MSKATPSQEQPAFLTLYQKQEKIYPRAVTGRFARWRWVMVWLTQLVFYGMPWLSWNGRQALLFDLETRQFYVLGLVLQPQDFIYLAALLVLSALALFFFHSPGRPPLVRVHLSTNGLHRDVPVGRAPPGG